MFTSNNVLVLDRDFYVISHGFHFHRFSKLTVVTKTLFVCFIQQCILLFVFCWCILFQNTTFSVGQLNLLCFYDKRKINIANMYKFTIGYIIENKQLSQVMSNTIS